MTVNPNQSADRSQATAVTSPVTRYFTRLIVGVALIAAAVFLFYAVVFISLMAGGGF